jgi:hypothetical protein
MGMIWLVAKNQKAISVFNLGGEPKGPGKLALKVAGFKQEVVSQDPYTIEITLKMTHLMSVCAAATAKEFRKHDLILDIDFEVYYTNDISEKVRL